MGELRDAGRASAEHHPIAALGYGVSGPITPPQEKDPSAHDNQKERMKRRKIQGNWGGRKEKEGTAKSRGAKKTREVSKRALAGRGDTDTCSPRYEKIFIRRQKRMEKGRFGIEST